jgi:hypothetical protein
LAQMKRYMVGLDFIPWLPLPLNRRVNRAKATLIRLAQKPIEHHACPNYVLDL